MPASDSSRTALSPGGSESDRLMRAVMSSTGAGANGRSGGSIYNTREPVQALANMESMTIEAVFILKDFHRHMDDPVVVRRLRDVGQKFSANRRTVIITSPELAVPAELTTPGRIFRSAAARSRPPARYRSRHFYAPVEDLHPQIANGCWQASTPSQRICED